MRMFVRTAGRNCELRVIALDFEAREALSARMRVREPFVRAIVLAGGSGESERAAERRVMGLLNCCWTIRKGKVYMRVRKRLQHRLSSGDNL